MQRLLMTRIVFDSKVPSDFVIKLNTHKQSGRGVNPYGHQYVSIRQHSPQLVSKMKENGLRLCSIWFQRVLCHTQHRNELHWALFFLCRDVCINLDLQTPRPVLSCFWTFSLILVVTFLCPPCSCSWCQWADSDRMDPLLGTVVALCQRISLYSSVLQR